MLMNPKGGSGKSNISTNLAGYYANAGFNVVMVDMDKQRSSFDWLESRPQDCKRIKAMSIRQVYEAEKGSIDYVIIDTPARLGFKQIDALLRQADLILIPVLPSPTDIRVAHKFINQLLTQHNETFGIIPVGIIANRSRLTTTIYRELLEFLKEVKYPLLATIRDSSHYLKCASDGKSIFEYKTKSVEKDQEDWTPLIVWLNKFFKT